MFADLQNEEEVEELEISNMVEFDVKTLLDGEFETLGFYVSAHPLDPFKEEISKLEYNLSSEIEEILGKEALFVGKIESMKVRMSKKGNKFAIATLMDFHGKIDIMIFERDLENLEKFNLDEPIAIKANVDKVADFLRITCKKIMSLEEAQNEKAAIKEEICLIERNLSENYEEELIKLYNEITKNTWK